MVSSIMSLQCLGCEHTNPIWEETCYVCGRTYDCDEMTLDTIESKWVCDHCLDSTFRHMVLKYWGGIVWGVLSAIFYWFKANGCALMLFTSIILLEFGRNERAYRHFVVLALMWALVMVVKRRES